MEETPPPPAARRSYLSVGPEAETAAASRNSGTYSNSKDGQQRCDGDAPHTHSTPTTSNQPPHSQGQDGTVGGHRPGHGCHAGRGRAKEARQHVIAEIWNVDLKPNAQAF